MRINPECSQQGGWPNHQWSRHAPGLPDQGYRDRGRPPLPRSMRGRPGHGQPDYVSDLTEEIDLAMRRDRMRSACPPGLRNLLIGLANIAVLVFIVVVINKIYYAHDAEQPEDVCFSDDR